MGEREAADELGDPGLGILRCYVEQNKRGSKSLSCWEASSIDNVP